jgi:hypothetical protein
MNVVLRWVNSFSGPPDPGSRYEGPGPASPNQAAAGPSVIGVLPLVVEQAGAGVQPLDHLLHDGAVVAEPDGAGEDEDVGRHHPLVERRPGVGLPAVFGHVGPHPGGDVVVDGAYDLDTDALALHQGAAPVDQALGVAGFG